MAGRLRWCESGTEPSSGNAALAARGVSLIESTGMGRHPQRSVSMSKNRLSHDQKRKAKLAKEAKKRSAVTVRPYEGEKYRADSWLPCVCETELGVYDAIIASHRTLSNRTVHAAFVDLVLALRDGLSPTLTDDEPEVLYTQETQREFIVWNIRRHWT